VTITAPSPTIAAEPKSLMPGVAWLADGKGMTITDPEQLKRVRRKELSPSTSFNLDASSCSVSMVASRLLPREDGTFEANQLGTAGHAVLESLLSLKPELRTKEQAKAIVRRLRTDKPFADELLGHGLAALVAALNEVDLAKWYYEVDRRALGLWLIEDPKLVTVYQSELGFGGKDGKKVNVGRVPIICFIDRVDKVLDVTTREIVGFSVVDYKMGHFKEANRFGDDYGDQIRLYVATMEAAEGLPISGGDLYFCTDGKRRTIDTSPEAVAITVKRFERAWDRMHKLADENFYPVKVGPLCSWCDLVQACPAAIADGKKDLSNTEKDAKGKRVVLLGPDGKPTVGKSYSPVALGIPTVREPAPSDRIIPTTPKTAGAAPVAAHNEQDQAKETKTMSDTSTTTRPAARILEGTNSRDSTINGLLNGNSYSAQAVFGLTSLAVETLDAAGQEINGTNVTALTQTFASIVLNVQANLSGPASYSDGLNTRIRGALRTSVETKVGPWGQDVAAFDAWVKSLTNRTTAIASVAITTFNLGTELPASPWAALAVSAA
jgi:putative RecB family exonuclease